MVTWSCLWSHHTIPSIPFALVLVGRRVSTVLQYLFCCITCVEDWSKHSVLWGVAVSSAVGTAVPWPHELETGKVVSSKKQETRVGEISSPILEVDLRDDGGGSGSNWRHGQYVRWTDYLPNMTKNELIGYWVVVLKNC